MNRTPQHARRPTCDPKNRQMRPRNILWAIACVANTAVCAGFLSYRSIDDPSASTMLSHKFSSYPFYLCASIAIANMLLMVVFSRWYVRLAVLLETAMALASLALVVWSCPSEGRLLPIIWAVLVAGCVALHVWYMFRKEREIARMAKTTADVVMGIWPVTICVMVLAVIAECCVFLADQALHLVIIPADSTKDKLLGVYLVFSFCWVIGTLYYTSIVLVASVTGDYYFTGKTYMFQNIVRSVFSMLGVSALAGVIMALINTLKLVEQACEQRSKNKRKKKSEDSDSDDDKKESAAVTIAMTCLYGIIKAVLRALDAIWGEMSCYAIAYCTMYDISLSEGIKQYSRLPLQDIYDVRHKDRAFWHITIVYAAVATLLGTAITWYIRPKDTLLALFVGIVFHGVTSTVMNTANWTTLLCSLTR